MGYRADIYINGTIVNELPKFYGYLDDGLLASLPSINWLLNNGKLEEEFKNALGDLDCIFRGPHGPEIKFTAKEFREFMNLYISDFEKYGREIWCKYPKGYNLLYSKKQLKDTYNNNADKVIEWG